MTKLNYLMWLNSNKEKGNSKRNVLHLTECYSRSMMSEHIGRHVLCTVTLKKLHFAYILYSLICVILTVNRNSSSAYHWLVDIYKGDTECFLWGRKLISEHYLFLPCCYFQEDLDALQGMKCQAPHKCRWGDVTYHNALVCGAELSSSVRSMDQIQVLVFWQS